MEMAAMETVAMETVAKENGDGTHGTAWQWLQGRGEKGRLSCEGLQEGGEAPLYIPTHGGCQVLVGRQLCHRAVGPIPASMVPRPTDYAQRGVSTVTTASRGLAGDTGGLGMVSGPGP